MGGNQLRPLIGQYFYSAIRDWVSPALFGLDCVPERSSQCITIVMKPIPSLPHRHQLWMCNHLKLNRCLRRLSYMSLSRDHSGVIQPRCHLSCYPDLVESCNPALFGLEPNRAGLTQSLMDSFPLYQYVTFSCCFHNAQLTKGVFPACARNMDLHNYREPFIYCWPIPL